MNLPALLLPAGQEQHEQSAVDTAAQCGVGVW